MLGVIFDYHDPHAHLRNRVEKAKQRLQRLMHFGYFPAETVAKIIAVQIVPLFTYGAIANCYREAQGMLLEVQGLIDHAVRRAAWAPSLNESVLRLPAQLGGLATPALPRRNCGGACGDVDESHGKPDREQRKFFKMR